MIGTELSFGDEVMIPWGNTEVRGRVAEVYGPSAQRRVVVALEPEMSSYVVDEATTVAIPVVQARKVVPLPKPLTVDAETDALITYAANLLDVSKEAFVADAVHHLAAAHRIEVEHALQAAEAAVFGTPPAESTGRARPHRPSP